MIGARGRSVLSLVLGVGLGAGLMLVGLAQAGRLTPQNPAALVALGQLLDTEHRRVDVLLEQGDVEAAIAALEALRRQRWPGVEQAGEAGIRLKHDAYGRLLRLRLDHPDIDKQSPRALLRILEESLSSDYATLEVNPFTARLVGMRGEVLELLDDDEAALGAYEEALEMNRTLLERELGEPLP